MTSTTTLERSERLAPGAAFGTITTALAGLYDTATEKRSESVTTSTGRLLVAAYELLRDGEIGDRVQQLGAALAACGHRQPTLLVERGLRVDLTPGAPPAVKGRYHDAVLLLCLTAQTGRLRRCEHARVGTVASLVPSCRHTVCTVAAQLDRQAGA